jgi:glc operon protein GlcG
MKTKSGKSLLLMVATAVAATLAAASPSLSGETRPFMTLDMAKKMADACEAYQAENDLPKFNIAVVDRGADLVLFRRQDDAFLGSIKIATQKAQSSASVPFPTRAIAEIVYGTDGNPGSIPGLAHSDVVAFAGGLPIANASGALVGAIGVSGGSADQDEDCAKAAVAAIAIDLN